MEFEVSAELVGIYLEDAREHLAVLNCTLLHLRYLVAALLVGGVIKLKVSGREVQVNGQQALEALRTNNTFKPVGVALKGDHLPPVVLSGRPSG